MKILLVEDDRQIIDFLKLILNAERFIVDVAEDGERAAFLGRCIDYDLIILDNMLPRKTGLEVCREVRGVGKKTPIIMLSVKTESSTTSQNCVLTRSDPFDHLMNIELSGFYHRRNLSPLGRYEATIDYRYRCPKQRQWYSFGRSDLKMSIKPRNHSLPIINYIVWTPLAFPMTLPSIFHVNHFFP
jgi:CheY-like chemotaxis protein